MIRVLFVCDGNVFRSVVAEYLLRKYCEDRGIEDVQSGSAGTVAMPERVDPSVIQVLQEYGVEWDSHTQRRVSPDLLNRYDVIVPMDTTQQKTLREKFGVESSLFNSIAFGEDTSISDVDDVLDDPTDDIEGRKKHISDVVSHVWEGMPDFTARVRDDKKDESTEEKGQS